MKPNIKKIIKAIVLAVVYVGYTYITVAMINKSSVTFPNSFSYINNGYDKILFSEISEIKKSEFYPDNILMNSQSFSSGYVNSIGGIFTFVDIIFTDENYVDFHNINIIKGSFFSDSTEHIGAIISENLANILFKSIDIIGGKFFLFDEEITVAGVYKPNNTFLSKISSDGNEYVMIPYNLNLILNDEVDYLYIKDKINHAYFSAVDETNLNNLLNGKLTNYKKIDLSENKKVILQFKSILFFLIGLIFFIVLSKKLFKFIIVLRNDENDKNIYFYIKMFGIIILLIIIPFIVFFDLYIPVNFFPADKNILNILHYINLFINFIQSQNINSYYFYNSLYFWSILLFIPLIIINLFITIKIAFKIMNYS